MNQVPNFNLAEFLLILYRITFQILFSFNCLFCSQLQETKSISKQTFLASVFFPDTGQVIILQKTVCFKYLYMHEHMYAEFMKKLLGQIPPGPSLGKQNILAKEVYRWIPCRRTASGSDKMLGKTKFRIFRQFIIIADISKRNVGERVY